MSISNEYWNNIVDSFNGTDQGFLNISKTEQGTYNFSVNQISDENSLILFKEILGENRLQRICDRTELSFDQSLPLTLSKENIHKIFIGMMDIKKEDIDELEGSFADRYKKLMFFENFAHFKNSFIKDSPDMDSFKFDYAQTSGRGYHGLVERVSLLVHHHFKVVEEVNATKSACRDAEMLTSRLADREIQKGTVVHLHDGYFYADEVFVSGGAYVSIFRDFENRSSPKIVCRGTSGYEGLVNNILVEIGIMGTKSIWPDLSKHLHKERIHEVEILGKSLGGAHAQQLAVLIEGVQKITVKKLTTYCSVGAGSDINQLFKNKILETRNTPFNIHLIRNGGDSRGNDADYVPCVGGEHIGVGTTEEKCKIDLSYISPNSPVKICLLETSILQRIKYFITSFLAPHCRQTTLNDFHWIKIEEREEINKHMCLGIQLEIIRKVVAITNDSTFTSYFDNALQIRDLNEQDQLEPANDGS